MKFVSYLLLNAMILGLFSISCSATKSKSQKPEPPKPIVEGPKLIGRIASIPAGGRFVLIQRYDKWEVEVGKILTTRGPDQRSANLKITGESLGEFAAADVQSGLVEVGDAVYLQHNVKPVASPASPEIPASETEKPQEDVQNNN